MNKFAKGKRYKELTNNAIAEEYIKSLEQLYTDIVSVPMFEDDDVMLEDWGVSFFHKESQTEIAWTVIVCMMNFINQTGHLVSPVIKNTDFKFYAEVQEKLCLGESVEMAKDDIGLPFLLGLEEDEYDF